jgi:hypothetical protein
MAGAGKRRDPAAALEPRVPPDVVDVEMRAQHEIDRLRGEPGRCEIVEERRLHHVERRAAAAVLVVADAGIDDHPQAGRLDHEGLDGLQQAPFVVEEAGRQPLAMTLEGLGQGVGQEPRGPRGAAALDDGGDAKAADGQRMHAGNDIIVGDIVVGVRGYYRART